MRYLYYSIWLSIAISFLCIYSIGNAQTLNTGNVLTNSTFGTGNNTTTTGWSTDGDEGVHTHGAWNGFPYQTGMDDSGGVLAFEGHEEDNVYQDVDLVGDGHLTQQEVNQGFTSTMGADVWFWNSIENTLTLKQTVTGSDGSVSTQVRDINDHDPNRNFNEGEFTNYTNVYTQGSNTQTDFTIRAELYNETAGTTYDNYHRGPDVDNVTLDITYTYIPPINEETQDIIDDIDTDIVDIIEDIPDDFNWYEEDLPIFEIPIEEEIVFEDEFTFDDSFYFEDIEIVDIEELPPIEEFDMEVFEEMPEMEMVFFEEEFSEPMMVTEEIFTEEFEEDFTEFLEETGMEEEFMEFLEDEGITAEEFFEEITEEEFNDELTEESFEEFEEPMEDIATEEEGVQTIAENENEGVEEPTESKPVKEEKEVANNDEPEEKSKEDESSSEGAEESEVQAEEDGEQETVQSEEPEQMDTDDGVATDVAKVETKLNKNLKAIAKQIAKVTKETTQNLSKEDLFFKDNSLDAYKDIVFYSAKDIYENASMGLFLQIDLSSYSKEIYVGASLSSYTQNDPVEIHRVKLLKINKAKNKILAELEALRQ
jgi:hypothetical protein